MEFCIKQTIYIAYGGRAVGHPSSSPDEGKIVRVGFPLWTLVSIAIQRSHFNSRSTTMYHLLRVANLALLYNNIQTIALHTAI